MTPKKLLKRSQSPESVVEAVPDSPMGKKWSQVARIESDVKYVVCNGDEGDPGAFMDGSVMEEILMMEV